MHISGPTWFRRGLQSIEGIPRTRHLVKQWDCYNCKRRTFRTSRLIAVAPELILSWVS
jgi:hypothetical protein